MRVLIADDQALVRHALRTLLEARGHEVADADCADDALDRADLLLPDVLLIGLALPLHELVDLVRRTSEAVPHTNVVVLTDRDDEETLFEVVRAGARGYVTKELDGEDFCTLLERAGRGESGLTSASTARVLDAFTRGPEESLRSRRLNDLTEREREVLTHMAQGVTSNRDLASSLGVSENTIRFHMRNILEKLQLHTRAAAAVYALTHGLVRPMQRE